MTVIPYADLPSDSGVVKRMPRGCAGIFDKGGKMIATDTKASRIQSSDWELRVQAV